MPCKYCQSKKLFFYKFAYKNDTYHYKYWCQDCNKQSYVERSREIYERVKDMPWVVSYPVLMDKYQMTKSAAKKMQRDFIKRLRDTYYQSQ